jgi:stearoyl-CoA desaturase (delta-9 desaturase)
MNEAELYAPTAFQQHLKEIQTRYVRSLRQVCAEEARRLKAAHGPALDVRALRRWVLSGEAGNLKDEQRQQLEVVAKESPALATVLSMREELTALWARSNASREQLLAQLQDWIARAEQSGIRQLQEFSLSLRRYAV